MDLQAVHTFAEHLSRTRALLFLSVVLSVSLLRRILGYINKRRLVRKKRCRTPPTRPAKWLLGTDFVVEGVQAIDDQRFLEHNHRHFDQFGDTFENKFLGINSIVTRDPVNVQAILATQFKDFDHGLQRYKAFSPLLGDGIFTLDGSRWSHGRTHLRPHFSQKNFRNLDFLEPHVSTLIRRVLTGNSKGVDLQPLFFNLTLDTSTQFLFGKSVRSLESGSNDGSKTFGSAFNFALKKIFQRVQLGPFYGIVDPFRFQKSCEQVRKYALRIVKDAAKSLKHERVPKSSAENESESSCLLEDLLLQDHLSQAEIGDQLIKLLVAARDTTASALSNLWFELARNPEVLERAQKEIRDICGEAIPDLEIINKMKYLRCVINEGRSLCYLCNNTDIVSVLRLYPPIPVNMRFANCLTTIPRGGGDFGDSSVVIEKGEAVAYSTYSMHRDRKLYGEDAEVFKPDRWVGAKHTWDFIPFSGGPRICLGREETPPCSL